MSDRETINNYLDSFSRYLSRLKKQEADDVLREIESHIYDAIEMAETNGEMVDVNQILNGFGAPRELAEQYTSHMIDGTPPPEGFSAITTVKHGVTNSVYWATWILGYGVGLGLIVLSILKLLFPDSVGLWVSNHGQSVVVGMVDVASQQGDEMLGMWFIPLGLIVGLFSIKATFVTLKALRKVMV